VAVAKREVEHKQARIKRKAGAGGGRGHPQLRSPPVQLRVDLRTHRSPPEDHRGPHRRDRYAYIRVYKGADPAG
jgi:hypothetical protein